MSSEGSVSLYLTYTLPASLSHTNSLSGSIRISPVRAWPDRRSLNSFNSVFILSRECVPALWAFALSVTRLITASSPTSIPSSSKACLYCFWNFSGAIVLLNGSTVLFSRAILEIASVPASSSSVGNAILDKMRVTSILLSGLSKAGFISRPKALAQYCISAAVRSGSFISCLCHNLISLRRDSMAFISSGLSGRSDVIYTEGREAIDPVL